MFWCDGTWIVHHHLWYLDAQISRSCCIQSEMWNIKSFIFSHLWFPKCKRHSRYRCLIVELYTPFSYVVVILYWIQIISKRKENIIGQRYYDSILYCTHFVFYNIIAFYNRMKNIEKINKRRKRSESRNLFLFFIIVGFWGFGVYKDLISWFKRRS